MGKVSLFKVKNKGESPAVLLSEKQIWEYTFLWYEVYVDLTLSCPSKISLKSCQTCCYYNLERLLSSHSVKTNIQH